MKGKIFTILLLFAFLLGLCGCTDALTGDTAGTGTAGDTGTAAVSGTDVSSDTSEVSGPAAAFVQEEYTAPAGLPVTVEVKNTGGEDLTVSDKVVILFSDGRDIEAYQDPIPLPVGQTVAVDLGLSDAMGVEAGEYTVQMTLSGASGTVNISCKLTLTDRDLFSLPLAELTDAEVQTLGKYLCDTYAASSVGLFASVQEVPSRSMWKTIQTLNFLLFQDTSPESRTLQAAKDRAAVFFPGAAFVPEDVATYDAATQTFAEPISYEPAWQYEFLSAEVKDGAIAVYYRDLPDPYDPDAQPGEYCTTLRPGGDGLFAYVSSVRTNPVG